MLVALSERVDLRARKVPVGGREIEVEIDGHWANRTLMGFAPRRVG